MGVMNSGSSECKMDFVPSDLDEVEVLALVCSWDCCPLRSFEV